ncbi:hypothetical protein DNTS_029269 [Danionella cerebrum]|uniref:Uncharacterized protein n=1 Tax=Danionella cerebrum TaxID=2873325 RepID=A0A553QRM7_9TELE|nr:hypothetical protein DNTS_029269 [Danionella translucida]
MKGLMGSMRPPRGDEGQKERERERGKSVFAASLLNGPLISCISNVESCVELMTLPLGRSLWLRLKLLQDILSAQGPSLKDPWWIDPQAAVPRERETERKRERERQREVAFAQRDTHTCERGSEYSLKQGSCKVDTIRRSRGRLIRFGIF